MRAKPYKYPWEHMAEPGGKFIIPGGEDPKRTAKNASHAARRYESDHPGIALSIRRVGNDIHVWRLA